MSTGCDRYGSGYPGVRNIKDIWVRILGGDPSAWEELFLKYAPLVYSVARRTVLRQTEAEDCAQQTWMALYTARHTIRDPLHLPGWLTSTSRRKAMRTRRRQLKADELHESADAPPEVSQPDEAIMAMQRTAQLELAVEQLDDRCRRVLTEIFLAPEDLSYRDLALRLGMAENSLGPTRMRCLKKLRKILERMGYE
jgi:RNA polymerase sigma factor (sigma-70 family)